MNYKVNVIELFWKRVDNLEKQIEKLKKLIVKKGTKYDLTRITAFGYLIETTDFLNIPPAKKEMIKQNMIWCNKQYAKYVDTTK